MYLQDNAQLNEVPNTQAFFEVGRLVDRLIAENTAVATINRKYHLNVHRILESLEALRIHSLEATRQLGIKSSYAYCIGSSTEIAYVDESEVLQHKQTKPNAQEFFSGFAVAATVGTPADNRGAPVAGLEDSLWLTVANVHDRSDLSYVRLAKSTFYVPNFFMNN